MSIINTEKKTDNSGYFVICKICGTKKLKWRANEKTFSGWELYDPATGLGHNCYSSPKVSEKDRLLQHFLDHYVYGNEKLDIWIPTEDEKIDMKILHDQYDAFYRKRTFFS